MEHFDVVVVGAGPTGFTLAIDLGRRGVRTLLLERDRDTKHFPKMDRSNSRTMEFYRRLGIAEQVRAVGYPPEASMDVFITTRLVDPPLTHLYYPSVAEHRETIAAAKDHSEPLEPYQLVSQNDLEPVLKRVAEHTPNVTVRFGCEVLDFDQSDDGVELTTRSGQDGVVETLRTAYLVGCDGASSTVRKKLGIPLEGQGNLIAQKQIAFYSEDLYESIPIGKGRHYYLADEQSAVFVVQGSRKHFTLNIRLPDGADYEAAVRERIGFDVDVTIGTVTDWRLHLLLAARYREKRVLIAGDAAHLVIPTGGLGMNSGVGDAIDLAWKLAGTVQGWGGPGLLDSYEVERRKVGARNVQASGWAAQGMGMWRALVKGDVRADTPGAAAMRAEIAKASAVHHRRVHEMIGVEFGYSYAGSELIGYEPDNVTDWDTTVYTPHTRPGVRVPHIWLADGQALQDVLGDGYSLVDLTGHGDSSALAAAFAEVGAPFGGYSADEPHVREVYGCSLLLLRPDLHIFWRGESLPDDLTAFVAAATGHGDGPYSAPPSTPATRRGPVPEYRPDFDEVLDGLVDPAPDPANLERSKAALRGWMTTTHEKDLDGVRALMADDIVVEIPFNESGIVDEGHYRVYRGVEECVGFWAVAFQAEGDNEGMLGCEINFTADGRVAFLEGRGVLRMANGRTYRNRYVMKMTFEAGKVSHVWEYYNPIQSAYGFRRKIAGQFYLDTLEPETAP